VGENIILMYSLVLKLFYREMVDLRTWRKLSSPPCVLQLCVLKDMTIPPFLPRSLTPLQEFDSLIFVSAGKLNAVCSAVGLFPN